jgi:hypothetical protein
VVMAHAQGVHDRSEAVTVGLVELVLEVLGELIYPMAVRACLTHSSTVQHARCSAVSDRRVRVRVRGYGTWE